MSSEQRASATRIIPSEVQAEVCYELQHRLGEGGMAVAYFALRKAPAGSSPVVLKVTRPEVLISEGDTANLSFRKEVVALGRLNEQVPQNPFVVRLVDTGTIPQNVGHRDLHLPWLALEYVHGGSEGSTLFERVTYSLAQTGYAFDAARAAHCLQCISSGLAAIHEVGVVHRDLSPSNVLTCGFGESELFKIADFGIARAEGITATFGDVAFGTPGYSAPEQTFEDKIGIGPWSDVFSLACIAFYVLTGEDYLPVKSATDSLLAVRGRAARRKLQQCPHLCPDLVDDDEACKAIDDIIKHATAPTGDKRPQRAQQFATSLIPWLTDRPKSRRPNARLVESVLGLRSVFREELWSWTVRHPPGDSRIIRSASWGADGHCLVATLDGLEYWNGDTWMTPPQSKDILAFGTRFVHRIGPGEWLLGHEDGTLTALGSSRKATRVPRPKEPGTYLSASGDLDDLMVVLSELDQRPSLHASAGGRWLRRLLPSGVASIADAARVDDELWLLAGRSDGGTSWLATYEPLEWRVEVVAEPKTRALVACAGQPDRGLGLAAGAAGVTARFDQGDLSLEVVPGEPDLSAAGMDVLDREWVGAAGRLWVRDPESEKSWNLAWEDGSWSVPFVSLLTEPGIIVAVTVDGAVLEGRSARGAVTQQAARMKM